MIMFPTPACYNDVKGTGKGTRQTPPISEPRLRVTRLFLPWAVLFKTQTAGKQGANQRNSVSND